MDESGIRGLELYGSNGGIGNCRASKICVKGYDTSLREHCLKLALRKHFASCGRITHVYVPRDFKRGILKRRAYITICGEDAVEKALELSGSDLGGRTVIASKAPPSHTETVDPGWASIKNRPPKAELIVTGFDTSLADLDIQIGLSRYFSSCGDIFSILVLKPFTTRTGITINGRATISIEGESAAEKAKALSGSIVGGWKIDVVQAIPHVPRRQQVGFSLRMFALQKEKEKEKKKEMEKYKAMYQVKNAKMSTQKKKEKYKAMYQVKNAKMSTM